MLPLDVEQAVLGQLWVKALGDMPRDERLPRVMSAPHPRAIGSYVDLWLTFCRETLGWSPFWWQQLVAARVLEHDENGDLVWLSAFVSTTRQVGKSALLRSLAMFRIATPKVFGRYGEPPNVFMSSTTLKLANEVLRPALAWADGRVGWRAFRGAMATYVLAPTDGRWLIGPANSTHGFTVGQPITDEAWGIDGQIVEDHMEPTMLAADQPQFLVTSTAHPKATSYVPNLRANALGQLLAPDEVLIVEWSVDRRFDDVLDEGLWRIASPRWTRQRERLLRAKVSSGKVTGDAFRAQYLNQWPNVDEVALRTLLIDPTLYARSQGAAPIGRGDIVVLAVEDWFGNEGAVALAEVRDGLVWVSAQLFDTRSAAFDYVDAFVVTYGDADVRVLLGASLSSDPRVESLPLSVELRGSRETKTAIGLYRSMLRDGLLRHDVDAPDLTAQMLTARITSSGGAGARFDETERHDVVSAAIWAAQEAATAFGMVEVSQ